MTTPREIQAALAAPFDPREVKFKPQSVKGTRALALAYIDCRVIQDRLDEVLGVENWQDDYTLLPDNSVVCRLRLRIGDKWVSKMDVGSPSEQPDGGDRLKAAFSDALKRAAVKFGIGRYIYRLKSEWCDYDPVKKQFVTPPRLPAEAKPVPALKPPTPAPVPSSKPAPIPSDPKTGSELRARLEAKELELTSRSKCKPGELFDVAVRAVPNAPRDLAQWSADQVQKSTVAVREFVLSLA
jgi:Rad52/22 family double-strand break repair protein